MTAANEETKEPETKHSQRELKQCIHARYIETSPDSGNYQYIPVCNSCYLDYEIEGIEIYSMERKYVRG